jgi:uncharacterized Zn finger protein
MLSSLISRATLREIAGPTIFERGVNYFEDGLVASLTEQNEQISGKVRGTHQYRVKLWEEEGSLSYDCTCPMGFEGQFCKHCVAVGLAWLAGGASKSRESGGDVEKFVRSLRPDALVDLILKWAKRDEAFRRELLLKAKSAGDVPDMLKTFKKAIDKVVVTDDFIDDREMRSYIQDINDVVGSVAELLAKGQAAVVIELCEYAMERVQEAIVGNVDDSNGSMEGILQRLQDMHLEACIAAKPDQEELAKRLLDFELSSEFAFQDAVVTYAEALGEKGLARYRELAEAEWVDVPQLKPGENASDYSSRYRITCIMETLARQSGDIERLVAVEARNLSHAYGFLQIAEIYHRAQQHDKALEWAERGVKAFPERTDNRLRDFLAEEYLRRKRIDEALNLIWVQFAERPGVENYKKLHRYSNPVKRWQGFRERALETLRREIQSEYEASKKSWRPLESPDNSRLVEIFIWEGDTEAAWREANAGGTCRRDLWLQLAAMREKDHPTDSIKVYKSFIDPIVEQKNNNAYKEAAELLGKIKALMERLGEQVAFHSYLTNVRAVHKPKRNFMKLLERFSSR